MAYNPIQFHLFSFNYIKNKLIKFQTEEPIEFDSFKTKYNIDFLHYEITDTFQSKSAENYGDHIKILNYIAFTYGFERNKSNVSIILQEKSDGLNQIVLNINGFKALLFVEGDRRNRCVFDWHHWNSVFQISKILDQLQNDKEHIRHILKKMFDFNYMRKTSNFHIYGLTQSLKKEWQKIK